MKKIILLFSLLLVFAGCKDDDLQEDTRLLGKEGIYIYHVNPLTGEDYTAEELADLPYNPLELEEYGIGETISIQIVAQARPLKVIISSADNTWQTVTLTAFKAYGDEWISEKFNSEVTELGLEVGEQITLDFEIIYNDQNRLGYDDPSLGSTSFDVRRVEDRTPTSTSFLVFLKKQVGEIIGLVTEDEVSSIDQNAQVGSAVTFNGTDNRVTVESTPDLDFRYTGNHSIGFWVNTTSTVSDPAMVSDKDWGGGGNDGFVFAFTGGSWKLNYAYAAAGARIDLDGGIINDGEWHFLMMTIDRSGDLTIYQDGVVKGSADISPLAGASIDSGFPIRIGQDGTGNYGSWFEGLIGNVFVYDYALSAEEVADASVFSGATLRTKEGAVSNIGISNEGGAAVNTEEGRYTYTFDGSNYVALDNGSDLDFRYAENFSIAFWVNTTSTTSDPSMVGDKNWGGGSNDGFVFAFTGSNWKLNYAGAGNRVDLGGDPINDGQWHLLVATFDRSGDLIIYQDGVAKGSVDISPLAGVSINSGLPIHIAQDGTGSYGTSFTGKIANSMIFDYVLSEEEIEALLVE